MKRPRLDDPNSESYVTTPLSASMMALLGPGIMGGSVVLSRDEFRAINKLYGYKKEKPNKRPDPPLKPDPLPKSATYEQRQTFEKERKEYEIALKAWERWEDRRPFLQAGADRDALRHAEADGLRMLAWIAKHISPGEDPVKALIQLASDAKWDVDAEDIAWSETDHNEDEDLG